MVLKKLFSLSKRPGMGQNVERINLHGWVFLLQRSSASAGISQSLGSFGSSKIMSTGTSKKSTPLVESLLIPET